MSPNSLAALVPTQYKPGQSGNAGGRPSTKPLTDGMRMLLAGDLEGFRALPRPLQLQIARWYGDSLTDPRSRALLLDRIEGRVAEELPPPLPEIVVEVQRLVGVYRGPVGSPRTVIAERVTKDG